MEGLIHLSELGQGKVTDPEEVVSVGQDLDTKIIKIEVATRKIGLSIRAMTEEMEPQEEPDNENLSAEGPAMEEAMSASMSGLQSALADAMREQEAEAGTRRLKDSGRIFLAAVKPRITQPQTRSESIRP